MANTSLANCELAEATIRPVMLSMLNMTTLPEDSRTHHLCAIPTSAPAGRLSSLQHAEPPPTV
jgi:hypothetical protein